MVAFSEVRYKAPGQHAVDRGHSNASGASREEAGPCWFCCCLDCVAFPAVPHPSPPRSIKENARDGLILTTARYSGTRSTIHGKNRTLHIGVEHKAVTHRREMHGVCKFYVIRVITKRMENGLQFLWPPFTRSMTTEPRPDQPPLRLSAVDDA